MVGVSRAAIALLQGVAILGGEWPNRGMARDHGGSSAITPLTSPEAILRLAPDDIAEHPVATIVGTVTMVHEYAPGKACFTIQQGDHAIYVDLLAYQERLRREGVRDVLSDLRPGTTVEVTGTVDPGAFAPKLMASTLRVVGVGLLPDAAPADLTRLFEGADVGRRLEIVGTVQGVEERPRHGTWLLPIAVGGHRVLVELHRRDFPAQPDELIDAEVRVIGVVSSIRNSRGEAVAPKLAVGRREDVVVTLPAPESPFAAEAVPLDEIARYRFAPRGGHRLRTEGVVTRSFDRSVFLQDGEVGVRVDLATAAEPPQFAPGDRVEVAGFLTMTRGIAGLTSSQARRLTGGVPPAPLPTSVADILAVDRRSHDEGTIMRPGNHDGCLVRCRGRVASTGLVDGSPELVLADGRNTFSAKVPPGHDAARPAQGSEVELTGIVQVDLDANRAAELMIEHPEARRLTLLLASPADIAVLRSPPWWNATRLTVAAGVLGTLLAAGAVWVWMLRREVARQTSRAVDEAAARRQGDLEYEVSLRERNRLAADLHDTILQTVTGIGFQLQVCEETRALAAAGERAATSPDDTLASAKRMVEHAVGQLRSAVWSLRTQPAAGMVFSEAVQDMVDRQGLGQAARISTAIDPAADQLPADQAGGLLQIIKEAVHNSLHHARPHAIDVRVGIDTAMDVVVASVSDDGVGFELGRQAGPARRHFGLTGMRERADALDGTLEIRTSPGAGTTIVVSAPLAGARR